MTDTPSIQILVTPDFQGQLRKLAKSDETTRAVSEIREIIDRFNQSTETT